MKSEDSIVAMQESVLHVMNAKSVKASCDQSSELFARLNHTLAVRLAHQYVMAGQVAVTVDDLVRENSPEQDPVQNGTSTSK